MPIKRLIAIAIFCLTLIMLVSLVLSPKPKSVADINFAEAQTQNPVKNLPKYSQAQIAQRRQSIYFLSELNNFAPVEGCELQAPKNPTYAAKLTKTPITLERFRRPLPILPTELLSDRPQNTYNPREVIALAANSNYGDRYLKDLKGKPANLKPIIVLHETVAPTNSVIGYFQAFQPYEEDQVSYHTLITIDGSIIYFVPPDKRAFGAGNSVFVSASGREAVKTNPNYASSVNNFAYHIALETPSGGMHNGLSHNGYTNLQYQSLAWLVAKTDVPFNRITTHRAVDRSASRIDPRSFNRNQFKKILDIYPRTSEISIRCPDTSQNLDKISDLILGIDLLKNGN